MHVIINIYVHNETKLFMCNSPQKYHAMFIKCKTMNFDIYVQLIVNKNTLVYIFEN